MEKYKISNLGGYEFEKVCRSILSVHLNKPFKRFGLGRDKGIDLLYEDSENKIIVQCKQYATFSSLKGTFFINLNTFFIKTKFS